MLSVGLTGGIASGKTTVSNLFAALGVPVIDTDIISRRLLETGSPAYTSVRDHFGDPILEDENKVDRGRLRELIFSHPDEKRWLENLLHPLIAEECGLEKQRYTTSKYLLIVVPLLFEAGFEGLVERICVVDCPQEVQITRLLKRDGISLPLAKDMLAQQWSNGQRTAAADDIIDNHNAITDLASQITALHQSYLRIADDQQ